MKLLTLNLRHDADRWEQRAPLVVAELGHLDPDVIAFQEVALTIRQAHVLAVQVAAITGRTYEVVVDAKAERDPQEGIAILTRLPILEHERRELPGGARVAQRVVVNRDGLLLNVINTHLHHRPPGSERTRLKQARDLLEWVGHQDGRSLATVLAGDMNAAPDSSTYALIRQRFSSAYVAVHGREPEYTFPTPLVRIPYPSKTLDYIFYSADRLEVRDVQIVFSRPPAGDETLYPSDHFGLMAAFA